MGGEPGRQISKSSRVESAESDFAKINKGYLCPSASFHDSSSFEYSMIVENAVLINRLRNGINR